MVTPFEIGGMAIVIVAVLTELTEEVVVDVSVAVVVANKVSVVVTVCRGFCSREEICCCTVDICCRRPVFCPESEAKFASAMYSE
jgi:hypothetical protein